MNDLEMNIIFKFPLSRKWTILNDRVICGKREIFLAEIEEIKASKKSRLAPAQIYLVVEGKELIITYDYIEDRINAEITFMHLKENCIKLKSGKDIQTLQEAEVRYEEEKILRKKENKELKNKRHEEKQQEKLIAQKARIEQHEKKQQEKLIAQKVRKEEHEKKQQEKLIAQRARREEEERRMAKKIQKIHGELNRVYYGNEHEVAKISQELALIISLNEHIEALATGINGWDNYILVCTDKSVIVKNRTFNYAKNISMYNIKSISYTNGCFHGEISITYETDILCEIETICVAQIKVMELKFFVDAFNRAKEFLWIF